MEHGKRTRISRNVACACAVMFSALFASVALGLWQSGTGLLYGVMGILSLWCAMGVRRCWKSGQNDQRAAALLLSAIVVEYWLWVLLASYQATSSYIFLFVIEGIRLFSIFLLIRFLYGAGSIDAAFNVWALKFFLLDFLIVLTSRAGGGPGTSFWEQQRILHPLYLGPLLMNFFLQTPLFALYIAKYRGNGKPDRKETT